MQMRGLTGKGRQKGALGRVGAGLKHYSGPRRALQGTNRDRACWTGRAQDSRERDSSKVRQGDRHEPTQARESALAGPA